MTMVPDLPVRLDRTALAGNPAVVTARKLQVAYRVRFCSHEEQIATLEGPVAATPGDAVVADESGAQWPVTAERFARKYKPIEGATMGTDGLYESLPCMVRAVRIADAFEVALATKQSVLRGRPGDWLIDYGDGSLGVVASAVFDKSYQIVGDENS